MKKVIILSVVLSLIGHSLMTGAVKGINQHTSQLASY